MRCDDRLSGCFLIVFGGLVFWRASTFPSMAGLQYGPGLFPSIAALGLMVCGAAIVITASIKPRRIAEDAVTAIERDRVQTPQWRARARVGGILAIVVGYGLLLEPLGFHIASTLAVAATAMVFGLSLGRALILAMPLVVLVHLLFYSVMHVPLPWGVLTPFAW